MLGRCVMIFSIIILQLAQKANGLESCGTNLSESRFLRIRVNSMKDNLGLWSDIFQTKAEHSDTLSDVFVDVKHNISQCSGRRIIEIQGVIQKGNYTMDGAVEVAVDAAVDGAVIAAVDEDANQQTSKFDAPSILFHHRHGRHIVVSNNRRTVERRSLKEGKHGSAFTNRPIRDNELFEVRIDKRSDILYVSLMIGILTQDPEEVEILPQMFMSEYAWMYIYTNIYYKGIKVKDSYGYDLLNLQLNGTLGIMKKPSGDIHFYVNGIDQGPAVSGISDPVYGVIDLWQNGHKVTIVKP